MEENSETPSTFGKRLKAIRNKLFLDQKRFAELMGISAPFLSAFENDKHLPRIEFVLKLSDLFDVNPNYLLLGVGNMFIRETELSYARAPEFAVNLYHVRDFLFFFERSHIVQFKILSVFREMMIQQKKVIEKELVEIEGQENK